MEEKEPGEEKWGLLEGGAAWVGLELATEQVAWVWGQRGKSLYRSTQRDLVCANPES